MLCLILWFERNRVDVVDLFVVPRYGRCYDVCIRFKDGGLKDEETVIAEHYSGYGVIPHGMRGACCGRR